MRCSTSQITGEIQKKNHMRYGLTVVKSTIIKKTRCNNMGKMEPLMGTKLGKTTLEKHVWRFLEIYKNICT